MIEKLTEKQISIFPFYVDKWIKIGLSCDPIDFEKTKHAVNLVYENGKLEKPKFIIKADSPLSALIIKKVLLKLNKIVRASVGASVRDSVGDSV